MKKFILYISIAIMVLKVDAQSVSIKLNIPDYNNSILLLCSQFGDKSKIIDTLYTNNEGIASYNSKNLQYGVYRIYFKDDSEFDIIINEPEISLSLVSAMPKESMSIIKSEENKVYYDFLRKNAELDKKLDVLINFLGKYPIGQLYNQVEKEYNSLIDEQKNLVNKIISSNSKLLASHIIKYIQSPIFPVDVIKAGSEVQYLKTNYFTLYPCNDETLINTPVYSTIIINYLKLFSVQSNYEASVNGFYKAAENLMKQTNNNERINTHFLNILINGFESLQLYSIADKLVATYGTKCLSDDNMSTRYRNVTELKEGSKAPILFVQNKNSEPEAFSFQQKTLVVFWATWCDHCRQAIPSLNQLYKANKLKNIDIVLISLDTNKKDLQQFIQETSLALPVNCDFLSWEGLNAKNYAVYATPFFYVIDENGYILAKPHDNKELMEFLK